MEDAIEGSREERSMKFKTFVIKYLPSPKPSHLDQPMEHPYLANVNCQEMSCKDWSTNSCWQASNGQSKQDDVKDDIGC
jgi:hypothetical protein